MANKYVYSGAAGSGTGADWANAYTTLGAAASGAAAGDDIWVASDHAETTAAASKVITFPGTTSSPNRVISVNRAGSVPPVAADILAGASVTTTGANTINVNGTAYVYGITFNCGTGANALNFILSQTTNSHLRFEACAFNMPTTNASTLFPCGGVSRRCEWFNCTVSFGATSQTISMSSGGIFAWSGVPGSAAVTGATIPTTLLTPGSGGYAALHLSGLDLSASGSGKTLVANPQSPVELVNCKLDASVTVAARATLAMSPGVSVLGCHSSGNAARNEIQGRYQGDLTTETTIKRTAGASDGTTAYSWKVVTTANAKRNLPFETFEGAVWNATTGSSKTLTIHTVTDNVTLTDAEIWVEVDYLGSSSTPVTTTITDANATVLTTAANQTSDSGEAWTTTGLTTPVKQKLEVTFTPQMTGLIRWRVKVGKASTTVYICPKPDVA